MAQTPSPKLASISSYQRIAYDLRTQIMDGRLSEGSLLPGRRALAAEYGVSVVTIQRAVADLIADGSLRTEEGRGTFVGVRASQPKSDPMLADGVPVIAQTPAKTSSHLLDRTMVVGIITRLGSDKDESGSEDSWKVLITKSLERALGEVGITSHYFNRFRTGRPPITIEESVELLQAEGADGLVFVMPTDTQEIASAFAFVNQKQIPSVFIDTAEITLPVPSVYCGDRDAGYQAADHLLLRSGCRDLLFFAPYTAEWVDLRLAGVREAVLLTGLPNQTLKVCVKDIAITDFNAVYGNEGTHDGAAYQLAQTLLTNGLPATGIIAANDSCALGFYQAAAEAGYIAGRDYALVGFDDLAQAQQLGITSLHPPLERLGQEATRAITRALSGRYVTTRTALNFTVVARRSSHFQKRAEPFAPIRVSNLEDVTQSIALY